MAGVPVVPARYGIGPMENPFDVSHEMRMAKSALLYADRVTLASWRVGLVKATEDMFDARERGDAQRLAALYLAIAWNWAQPGQRSSSAGVEAMVRDAGHELTIQMLEPAIGPMLEVSRLMISVAMKQPSWRELKEAEDLGILEVRRMGTLTGFGFSREAAIVEYLALVRGHLAPDAPGVPMLDYSAQGVYEVGTKVGVLAGPLPRAATELALATHYIGYIPTIGDVDLASIVRARQQLKRPLVRFRSIVGDLVEELDRSPIDAGFVPAADELFRKELAPQLESVRSLSRERGLANLFASEVVETKSGALAKAVIAIAAAAAAGVPPSGQAGIGATVVGAEITGGVARRRRELESKRSENGLVWLDELDRQLGRSS
jgi:hypothetical protein